MDICREQNSARGRGGGRFPIYLDFLILIMTEDFLRTRGAPVNRSFCKFERRK